jgi:hypothetical protein
MLRMKYLVTLTLVTLLMVSSAAFAGPWIAMEYDEALTPTSVPVPVDESPDWFTTATFSDVPSTGLGDDEDEWFWAWGEIEECAATHTEAEDFIVQGYGDGSYQPGLVVTRGMMAVFIARAAGYTDDVTEVSFGDVPDTYWAYTEIEQCVLNDVVKGYEEYFAEDDPETTEVDEGVDAYLPTTMVDRGQMAVYIFRAAGLTTVAYQGLFTDVEDTGYGEDEDQPHWAALEIEACADADIVQGYGGGIYLPENKVTRAQMAVFVWRGLVRLDGDVVLGGPAVSDDLELDPGAGNAGFLLPSAVTTTGANTVDGEDEDLPVEGGAVVFVVLDAAQVNNGTVDFDLEVWDYGDPEDDEDDVLDPVDSESVTVNAANCKAAVDTADGVPYLIVAYHVAAADVATAGDYVLTLTLPNGNVTEWEFTVEE